MEQHQVLILHRSENGEVVFDLADESGGTRTLLFLAGPILDILRKGLTLVIDELDTSLHTLLVRELVRVSTSGWRINTGKAQLIFSTHDTALMERAAGLLCSGSGLGRREGCQPGIFIGQFGGVQPSKERGDRARLPDGSIWRCALA